MASEKARNDNAETNTAEKANKINGEMSVREAGKKGGDTVRDRYGSGFYEKIGRKGGQVTRERHGAEFYEAIGQKGGKVVKSKYGSDFYEEIGHKGGQKVKKLIAEAKKSIADAAEAAEGTTPTERDPEEAKPRRTTP